MRGRRSITTQTALSRFEYLSREDKHHGGEIEFVTTFPENFTIIIQRAQIINVYSALEAEQNSRPL